LKKYTSTIEKRIVVDVVETLYVAVEKLGDCYVKVEDKRQRHCPLYSSFTALPDIHISRPFGVSVFKPLSDDREDQPSRTQHNGRDVEQSNKQQQIYRFTCSPLPLNCLWWYCL